MAATVPGVELSGPPLQETPLLSAEQAAGVATVFKILANDTRLRLLHALHRGGEVRVSDLAVQVGVSQQTISNQLQRLLDRDIVTSRKAGTNVYYSINDPCIPVLLQVGVCLLDGSQCA